MIRKPCVAGRFYPGEAEALRSTIEKFLVPGTKETALCIIAPHAGYMYSGAVAGAIYSSVKIPENIILIGPNHTGRGKKASVMASGLWEIPFGRIKINEELARLVIGSTKLFSGDVEAHLGEHSLEVQLPFIYTLNKNSSIVPVTVMQANFKECEEMGACLAGVISGYGKEVLIVVSSDMNHYEPDKKTRQKDTAAVEQVLKLDALGLLNVTLEKDITMCGVIPAAIAITAANRLKAKEARLVKYATSGDASGDYSAVVGYAGILIK